MADESRRPSAGPTSIRNLTHDQIAELVEELGQPKFRTKQIEEWLWAKNAQTFDEMTNLPAKLRSELAARFSTGSATEIVRQESVDGSRKYLLSFDDGVSVECVGMPSGPKLSVCASTQAGCGMGCAFCATGKAGLTRSL